MPQQRKDETAIVNDVLLKVNAIPGVRLWRSNTGVAYGPAEFKRVLSGLPARPVRFGVPGQADTSGLGPGGRRLEIECKTATGKQEPDQIAFERVIRSLGGVYILARSGDEAVAAVKREFGL